MHSSFEAHSSAADRGADCVDYYVKWCGLPYAECTWEVDTLIEKWFKTKIEQYYERLQSSEIPNKQCKVLAPCV